ncbi:hypothetical protein ACA910_016657 [Epithemia clementina (nom. ined.)]
MLHLRNLPVFALSFPDALAGGSICFIDVKSRSEQNLPSLKSGRFSLLHYAQPSPNESPARIYFDDFNCCAGNRRKAVYSLSLASLALVFPNSVVASSLLDDKRVLAVADFDVLSDLPPIPPESVLLFFCRHGQTEYNRLKLVQGSKTDAPINDNGKIQAEKLGKALSRATPPPEVIFHSPLVRTKQTAELASQQFLSSMPPSIKLLPELAEIDFGKVEGESVDEVRAKMVAAYTAWSVGNIDTRMARDGESFREILSRIQTTILDLTEAAKGCESRCIAAVAHSVYLRVLLAIVQDQPLFQASTMEQKNACINVVDFNVNPAVPMKKIDANNNLFGRSLSRAPRDFELEVPHGKVLRLGEKRHLGDLAT